MKEELKKQIVMALQNGGLETMEIAAVVCAINHCSELVRKLDKSFIEKIGLINAGILRGDNQ